MTSNNLRQRGYNFLDDDEQERRRHTAQSGARVSSNPQQSSDWIPGAAAYAAQIFCFLLVLAGIIGVLAMVGNLNNQVPPAPPPCPTPPDMSSLVDAVHSGSDERASLLAKLESLEFKDSAMRHTILARLHHIEEDIKAVSASNKDDDDDDDSSSSSSDDDDDDCETRECDSYEFECACGGILALNECAELSCVVYRGDTHGTCYERSQTAPSADEWQLDTSDPIVVDNFHGLSQAMKTRVKQIVADMSLEQKVIQMGLDLPRNYGVSTQYELKNGDPVSLSGRDLWVNWDNVDRTAFVSSEPAAGNPSTWYLDLNVPLGAELNYSDFLFALGEPAESHSTNVLYEAGSVSSVRKRTAINNAMQRLAYAKGESPPIIGVDTLHGLGMPNDVFFSAASINYGAAHNLELTEDIYDDVATQLRAMGYTWAFGPYLDPVFNSAGGRWHEGYTEDPHLYAELARAHVLGLQRGPGGVKPDGVMATCKHFMGTGISTPFTRSSEQTSWKYLRELNGAAFKACIDAGAGSVMLGSVMLNGQHAHHSKAVGRALRERLGFTGIVTTDYLDVTFNPATMGVVVDFPLMIERALNASVDLFMKEYSENEFAFLHGEFLPTLYDLVKSGRVPESRIDESMERIFIKKIQLGLVSPILNAPVNSDVTKDLDATEVVVTGGPATNYSGVPAVTDKLKQLATESLVLLKNDDATLPLVNGDGVILVTGPNSNNLDQLFGLFNGGGWTGPRNMVPRQLEGRTSRWNLTVGEWVTLTADDVQPDQVGMFYSGYPRGFGVYDADAQVLSGYPQHTSFVDGLTSGAASHGYTYSVIDGSRVYRDENGVPVGGDVRLELSTNDNIGKFNYRNAEGVSKFVYNATDIAETVATCVSEEATHTFVFIGAGTVLGEGVGDAGIFDSDFRAGNLIFFPSANAESAEQQSGLLLPADQRELILALIDGCEATKIVLVMTGQRVYHLGSFRNDTEMGGSTQLVDHPRISAFIWAGLPGSAAGEALSNIVFGDHTPYARLPFTFPASGVGNGGSPYGARSIATNAPRHSNSYDYGTGLSYTSFHYDTLETAIDAVAETITASCLVVNDGSVYGCHRATFYLNDISGYSVSSSMLISQTLGTQVVCLEPGANESASVTMSLSKLSHIDTPFGEDKLCSRRVFAPGTYAITMDVSMGLGGYIEYFGSYDPFFPPASFFQSHTSENALPGDTLAVDFDFFVGFFPPLCNNFAPFPQSVDNSVLARSGRRPLRGSVNGLVPQNTPTIIQNGEVPNCPFVAFIENTAWFNYPSEF